MKKKKKKKIKTNCKLETEQKLEMELLKWMGGNNLSPTPRIFTYNAVILVIIRRQHKSLAGH